MHYVRSLEQRVKQLEEEKLALQQKLGQVPGTNSSNGNWENDVRDQMICYLKIIVKGTRYLDYASLQNSPLCSMTYLV
jgi:hypothetical protein